MKVEISPGSISLCALAIELVGAENVIGGEWTQPITIVPRTVSKEDLQAALELIWEFGEKIRAAISGAYPRITFRFFVPGKPAFFGFPIHASLFYGKAPYECVRSSSHS